MRKYIHLFAAGSLLLSAQSSMGAELGTKDSISRLVRFLISDRVLRLNAAGQAIPPSFFVGTQDDMAVYFGDYLCTPTSNCMVVGSGRGLQPQPGIEQEKLGVRAQIERTEIKYGTDIYHGATWQIALALTARHGFLGLAQARRLVANELETVSNPVNRALGPDFRYGDRVPVSNPQFAFSFRRLTTNLRNQDPFFEGPYQYLISDLRDDAGPSLTTWSDWQPLTGKNAWAQLIGPLQAEYLLTRGRLSANSPALVNAMNSLRAFSLLQSGIGAFYVGPAAREGRRVFPSTGLISIEDNFAVLAGLQLLKRSLEKVEQTPRVRRALARIEVMLNGGLSLNGFRTNGLLSFLYNGAFDRENGLFLSGGSAPIPSSTSNWRARPLAAESFSAVNTNLWAISALGVETIDGWFGAGTALRLWQRLRDEGGYFNNGELWGFGYSLNNNLGDRTEGLMASAETAAAINALYSLISFYAENEAIPNLRADLRALQQNLVRLRNDVYLESNFNEATPASSFVSVPPKLGQAYLYASRRFQMPLDWNANTLASINANAWVLMNRFHFNPLQFAGRFEGENYLLPARVW